MKTKAVPLIPTIKNLTSSFCCLKHIFHIVKHFLNFKFTSPVYNFTTPIPPGAKTPFKFVVYGDLGLDPYPQATTTATLMRQEVEENNIRFIYHHGDISYARGQVRHYVKYVKERPIIFVSFLDFDFQMLLLAMYVLYRQNVEFIHLSPIFFTQILSLKSFHLFQIFSISGLPLGPMVPLDSTLRIFTSLHGWYWQPRI